MKLARFHARWSLMLVPSLLIPPPSPNRQTTLANAKLLQWENENLGLYSAPMRSRSVSLFALVLNGFAIASCLTACGLTATCGLQQKRNSV